MRPKNYYRNYRGRRTKGKAALAVLLVLVILAALAVIRMQRHVVYDETGVPRLDVPWQEGEEGSAPPPELDLVIQTPAEKAADFCGFSVQEPLSRETWALSFQQAQEICGEDLSAAVVTLKDSGGGVWFDSAAAVPDAVQFLEEETDAALNALLSVGTERGLHTVAALSCFPDSLAAKSNVDAMGLKNTSGYIFYDAGNSQWLDPAKPEARAYLCRLACEVAELGFDEILLTGVGYPSEGNLEEIAYGETAKHENLGRFLDEVRIALEPYGVKLSLELPAAVILSGSDEASGIRLAEVAGKVDRIFAKAAPEEAAALAEAVAAVGETTELIPVLTEPAPAWPGSYLLESVS